MNCSLSQSEQEALKIKLDLIPRDIPFESQQTMHQQIIDQFKKIPSQNELLENISKLNSNDIVLLHYGLMKLRQYISDELSGFQQTQHLIDLNIMKYLNPLIRTPNQYQIILYEAVWIIGNICCGRKQQVKYVVVNDGLQLIEKGLQCESLFVKDQAISAISNLAAESLQLRKQLIKMGIYQKVIEFNLEFLSAQQDFSEFGIFALVNFCKEEKHPIYEQFSESFDIFLMVIKQSESLEILLEACYGIESLSSDQRSIQKIIQADILPKIIRLMKQVKQMLIPAMKIIKDILAGDEEQKNYILIQPLDFSEILNEHHSKIQFLVIQAISNLTAGNIQQIHRIIYDTQLLQKLMIILQQPVPQCVFKYFILIFINALSNCTIDDAQHLVNNKLIEGLCNQFEFSENQEQISFSLIGIDALLEKGEEYQMQCKKSNIFVERFKNQSGFMNRLKLTSMNSDLAIQYKAQDIMKYFI